MNDTTHDTQNCMTANLFFCFFCEAFIAQGTLGAPSVAWRGTSFDVCDIDVTGVGALLHI
jgi:hypothetical protein